MKRSSSTFRKNEDTRIWCEYCRIFVYNNRINRDKHDNSPQHKSNFNKKVETLRKEEEESQKIVKYGTVIGKSGKSFYQEGPAVNLTSSQKSNNSGLNHVLNLKSSSLKLIEKKNVLGLSGSVSANKEEQKKSIDIVQNLDLPIHEQKKLKVDMKSISFDLKRKVKDDEKLVFDRHELNVQEAEIEDPSLALESLTMFKKKKTK